MSSHHARVALIRGQDRHDNIAQALGRIAGQVDLAGKQRVVIKPNIVVTGRPLATTHAEALRAVLEFVRARYDGPLTIAEGPSAELAVDGFRRLGYEPLARGYDATLLDLNHDDTVPVEVYDWRFRPLRLSMARTIVESDYRISVSSPKTHDVVIVTLSLKNMIMGALISRFTHVRHSGRQAPSKLSLGAVSQALWRRLPQWIRALPPVEWITFRAMRQLEPSDKMKMHQSYPVIHLNLALLAPLVTPHLAVLDGFQGMEGDGPSLGTPVPLRVALAGTDALAVDLVGATLMGFDPDEVGYLHYCKALRPGSGTGHLAEIEILGNARLEECVYPFRPHASYHRQRRWRSRQAEETLRRTSGIAGVAGRDSESL